MKDKIQDAVLMSLRPKWAALIATEKKTVEVRKKFPGMVYLPFKIYLYCTNVNSCTIEEYAQIHKMTSGRIDEWIGKVFGEVTCDLIYDIEWDPVDGYTFGYHKDADCLTEAEFTNYLQGGPGYGLRLKDPVIYDIPKDLSDFGMTRPPQSWRYVEALR